MGARTRAGTSPLSGIELPERYELVRLIARGGMGSVWCAHDAVLGRDVAIKLLGGQFLHDEPAIRRFQREARAAARLSGHPHVVTIYDVGQTEPSEDTRPQPFIVMEHLAGGSVADAIRAGAVGGADAVRWIRQAAEAIDHGHEQGIIHRDIKPANLLLDRHRTLHVGDFGIASVVSEETITRSGELFGTAAYLSPEQALGRPASAASDRYALAVAAFELLAGERPFVAAHFAAQARQHIEDEPPRASALNPRLPAAVDAVLRRGLAKAPEDRWGSAGAFAAALGSALESDAGPAVTPPTAAPPTLVRPRPRPATGLPSAAEPGFRSSPDRSARWRTRAIALAALVALAALLFATALGALGGGSPARTGTAARAGARSRPPAPVTRRTASAKQPAAAPASTAAASTAAASGSATSPTADALEARGHQLLLSGSYSAAVPVLRQAVTAASPSSLTYAYALFDLGRALRLAGDPQAAIPILQRRLQIPNQTGVVRQELVLAMAAASGGGGEAAPSPGASGGAAPTPAGHGHGHGHGGGGQGGD